MSKQHTWTTQCIVYSPSAHLLYIKHSLQFICYTWIKRTCSANAPLKPCMTEPKDNIAMQPFVCSYCSDWSIHSYRIQTPLGKGVMAVGVPCFHFTFWDAAPAPRTKASLPSRHGLALVSPALSWSRPLAAAYTLQSKCSSSVSLTFFV